MALQIFITTGRDKGRAFPLVAGETLQLGRSPAATVRLTDPTVSRVHCELEYDGQRVHLINISTSGTQVNGQYVVEQPLQLSDVVKIGNTELRLRLGDITEIRTIFDMSLSETIAAPKTKPATTGPVAAALAGQTLNNYLLEAVIAQGASGAVYKATDTATGQHIALKVLQPDFTKTEEEMQRFTRGMKTALPLRHPHLVPLHKAGKTGAFCWMAMDFIEGESMLEVIQRAGVSGMLDWRYGFRVAVHIARALEYAHSLSILHRNVIPQNILLRSRDQTALLSDLMLSKALEGALADPISKQGQPVGDIAYMSPERTRSATDADGRSDLYGLGATVYALITGRPPFGRGTLLEIGTRIRAVEPEKPRTFQPATPEAFEAAILKLLAKQPEQRYQRAGELIVELERIGKAAGARA